MTDVIHLDTSGYIWIHPDVSQMYLGCVWIYPGISGCIQIYPGCIRIHPLCIRMYLDSRMYLDIFGCIPDIFGCIPDIFGCIPDIFRYIWIYLDTSGIPRLGVSGILIPDAPS
jgi:hypothetical protein